MSDCQRRLQNELKKLKMYSDELKKGSDTVKEEDDLLKVTETIWISLNEKNLRSFTALIQGNEGTPVSWCSPPLPLPSRQGLTDSSFLTPVHGGDVPLQRNDSRLVPTQAPGRQGESRLARPPPLSGLSLY